MYNDWFSIGPLTIHGYGVMIAVGIIFAFWIGEKLARKKGLQTSHFDNLVFVCLISGYIGSKIIYILTDIPHFLADPAGVLLNGNGWVVYGGILGGILGAYIYCHAKKISFQDYCSIAFPAVAIAQGFGRIGCFFAGCCYGIEVDSPLSITFKNSAYAPNGVPLVPTQLMSSLGDFIIFFILYRNVTEGKHPEDTAALYLILYSAGRFLIEFLRGDASRGFIGVLSTSQFISLFIFAAGMILLWKNHHKKAAGSARA